MNYTVRINMSCRMYINVTYKMLINTYKFPTPLLELILKAAALTQAEPAR